MVNLCKYIRHRDGKITPMTLCSTLWECFLNCCLLAFLCFIIFALGMYVAECAAVTYSIPLTFVIGVGVIGAFAIIALLLAKYQRLLRLAVITSPAIGSSLLFLTVNSLLQTTGVVILLGFGLFVFFAGYERLVESCTRGKLKKYANKTLYTCELRQDYGDEDDF